MEMKKVLFFLILLSRCLSAQIGSQSEESKNFVVPNFYMEALANKSTLAGQTRLDVYLQVPFSNVQFVRKDTLFTASYTLTLTVFDENKENIFYDQNWVEKLQTSDFEEANSPFSANYSQRSIDLKPGKYTLYCSLEDMDSKKLTFSEAPLTVRGFSDTLEISDALLIEQIVKDKEGDQLIPNVSRVITNKTTQVPAYFEVYSDKNQLYTFEYTLKNSKGDTLFIKSEDKNLNKGTNKIDYTFREFKFVLGEIQLGIKIKKEGKDYKNYIKIISGRIAGIPLSINSIDEAIDQMAYIAPSTTINAMRNAPNGEERLKMFFAFWDTKKPSVKSEDNPIMKEYYKRVDYSNRFFKGRPAGWRSDMGMVYIILGPPDMVERQPMPANSRPYEVWSYNHLNKQYVFLDVGGFGSYVLQNPDFDILNGGGLK
jgi:GWxTD domain-containing protein